jgi:ABC-type enterochelin transport system permease subunit
MFHHLDLFRDDDSYGCSFIHAFEIPATFMLSFRGLASTLSLISRILMYTLKMGVISLMTGGSTLISLSYRPAAFATQ